MLHQISWVHYGVGIISTAVVYYLYAGFAFFQTDLKIACYRLTGKSPAVKISSTGDLHLPDYSIMGKAQATEVEYINQEELTFGPANFPEEAPAEEGQNISEPKMDIKLTGDFSSMMSEIRTLVRVINESGESKANFEMLIRLIIQKYPALIGSAYQDEVQEFILEEGVPHFPFSLSAREIDNYWLTENNLAQ